AAVEREPPLGRPALGAAGFGVWQLSSAPLGAASPGVALQGGLHVRDTPKSPAGATASHARPLHEARAHPRLAPRRAFRRRGSFACRTRPAAPRRPRHFTFHGGTDSGGAHRPDHHPPAPWGRSARGCAAATAGRATTAAAPVRDLDGVARPNRRGGVWALVSRGSTNHLPDPLTPAGPPTLADEVPWVDHCGSLCTNIPGAAGDWTDEGVRTLWACDLR